MKINPTGQIAQNNTQNAQQTQPTGEFASALKAARSRGMEDIFRDAAEEYDLPLNLLLAVGKAESNFNASCVSTAGAQGVMQLMPGTAKYLGVSDSFDPEQNIFGGAKYLREMLDKQGGDVELALAAYNAGPGNVKKYGGIPPFKETQNYVKKVMGYAEMGVEAPNIEVSGAAAGSATTSVQASESDMPEFIKPVTISQADPPEMPDAGESLKEYILMQILSMQLDSGWSKKEE